MRSVYVINDMPKRLADKALHRIFGDWPPSQKPKWEQGQAMDADMKALYPDCRLCQK
jgi:hypothetical protein